MWRQTIDEILANRPVPIEAPKVPYYFHITGEAKGIKRKEVFKVLLEILKHVEFVFEGDSFYVKKNKSDPQYNGLKLYFKGKKHKLERHFSIISFINEGDVDTMYFRLLESETDLLYNGMIVRGVGFDRISDGDKVDIKVFIMSECEPFEQ